MQNSALLITCHLSAPRRKTGLGTNLRDRLDQLVEECDRSGRIGLRKEPRERDLRGAVDGDEEVEPSSVRTSAMSMWKKPTYTSLQLPRRQEAWGRRKGATQADDP